jgi:hypothetical protein
MAAPPSANHMLGPLSTVEWSVLHVRIPGRAEPGCRPAFDLTDPGRRCSHSGVPRGALLTG